MLVNAKPIEIYICVDGVSRMGLRPHRRDEPRARIRPAQAVFPSHHPPQSASDGPNDQTISSLHFILLLNYAPHL